MYITLAMRARKSHLETDDAVGSTHLTSEKIRQSPRGKMARRRAKRTIEGDSTIQENLNIDLVLLSPHRKELMAAFAQSKNKKVRERKDIENKGG